MRVSRLGGLNVLEFIEIERLGGFQGLGFWVRVFWFGALHRG